MKTDPDKSETVSEAKSEATLAAPSGSAFPPGDDALCNVRRLRAEIRMLRAALQPLADLLDGDLENVGGGTLIAPTIKVQMVKDAKNALTPSARTYALRSRGDAAMTPNDPSSPTRPGEASP